MWGKGVLYRELYVNVYMCVCMYIYVCFYSRCVWCWTGDLNKCFILVVWLTIGSWLGLDL